MAKKSWSDAELDVLRLPITAKEMETKLPGRSNMSIRLRRRLLAAEEGFEVVNPTPDFAGLGRASGACRRVTEAERKAEFILAVESGVKPTHVRASRSAYQRWREKDPAFASWLDALKAQRRDARERVRAEVRARRAEDRALRREREARQVEARRSTLGEGHARALRQNDVYRIASVAIGPSGNPDVRDSAISAMVLDLLEGSLSVDDAKAQAPRYRSAAKREVSFKPVTEWHDIRHSIQAWLERDE